MQGTVTYYLGKIGTPNRGTLSINGSAIMLSDVRGQQVVQMAAQDVARIEFVANLPTFRFVTSTQQVYTISTINWAGGQAIGALMLGLIGMVSGTLLVYFIVSAITGYGIFGLFAGLPVFILAVRYMQKRFHKNNASNAEGGPTTDQWQTGLAQVVGQAKITSVNS